MDIKKKTGFISPETFITALRGLIKDSKDEDTIAVGEIRGTLNRVVIAGVQTPEAILEATLTRVREYKENNPQSAGITSSHLWRDLMGMGFNCTLDSVDAALSALFEIDEIDRHFGQVTAYTPVDKKENKT